MTQREETLRVLGALAAAFPYAKIERPTIEIYAEALADIPPAVLKAAGVACISRSTFFPAISEIRDEALRAMSPERPSPEAAWQEVLEQVRSVHFCGTPQFSDPLIAKVVEGVGWRDICMCEEPGVPRGQFYKLYAAALERERHEALLPSGVRQMMAQLRVKMQVNALPEAHDGH
jgi:hypothetical protein